MGDLFLKLLDRWLCHRFCQSYLLVTNRICSQGRFWIIGNARGEFIAVRLFVLPKKVQAVCCRVIVLASEEKLLPQIHMRLLFYRRIELGF